MVWKRISFHWWRCWVIPLIDYPIPIIILKHMCVSYIYRNNYKWTKERVRWKWYEHNTQCMTFSKQWNIYYRKNNAFSIVLLKDREGLFLGILGLESCGWKSNHWACANKIVKLQKCVIKKPQYPHPSYDANRMKMSYFCLWNCHLIRLKKLLMIDFSMLCWVLNGHVNNRSFQKHNGHELKGHCKDWYYVNLKTKSMLDFDFIPLSPTYLLVL